MGEAEKNDILKRIESGYSLPSLSVVAVQLVEIASDDTCSVNDLISLIEQDPSLAVNLLRMANSALFLSGQPVISLRQAIMRIGFHQLRIMGLSLSLRNTFPMGKKESLDYEHFWRVSLYRGLIAKSLAERLKTCNPDEAFVGGLILEIGYLIFHDLFLKGKKEGFAYDLTDLEHLLSWERREFGITHREVGEAALSYWRFPEMIVACQEQYCEEALVQSGSSLARICESSRVLSLAALHRETDFHMFSREATGLHEFSDEAIRDIVFTAFEQVEDVAQCLRLELNKERDLLELIEKANRTLGRISERIAHYQDTLRCDKLPDLKSLEENGQHSVEFTLQAVAHEIRNPLLSVAGFARRLAKTMDPASESGRYVQIILDEAVRLESALDEMVH